MLDALMPLYRLYERRLLREIQQHPLPCHIGLILDGNRRYARELGLEDPMGGHRVGADKLEEVMDWLEELDIRITTLFALSTENLTRSPAELTGIIALIEDKMRSVAVDPKIHRKGVRIRAVGQRELLPASLQEAIALAEEATRGHDNFYLNIAVGYGGRQEITDAVALLLRDRARRVLVVGAGGVFALASAGTAMSAAAADAMFERARTFPGFVDVKSFKADDGERLTVVWWENEETLAVWRNDMAHRAVQEKGRERWYQYYKMDVAQVVRVVNFERSASPTPRTESAPA